jgi:hypothetical protein
MNAIIHFMTDYLHATPPPHYYITFFLRHFRHFHTLRLPTPHAVSLLRFFDDIIRRRYYEMPATGFSADSVLAI